MFDSQKSDSETSYLLVVLRTRVRSRSRCYAEEGEEKGGVLTVIEDSHKDLSTKRRMEVGVEKRLLILKAIALLVEAYIT